MNINNNISSIMAHTTLLNSSANNIANMNTNGYERENTKIVNENNIQAITSKEENKYELSNTNLVKETANEIISYHAIGANLVAIKTKDDVDGALLDILA